MVYNAAMMINCLSKVNTFIVIQICKEKIITVDCLLVDFVLPLHRQFVFDF